MDERVAIGGGTRVAGIIGWPVDRSLSPAIHNAAFAAAGLDWVYVAFPVRPERVPEAIAGMRALGVEGMNVTMPHKRAVMPCLDEVTGEAGRIGAVNTIVRRGDRLTGSNTDGQGFVRFLERDAHAAPAGRRVVLLGAGGAARALAVGLSDASAEVFVAARRAEQADEILQVAPAGVVAWDADELSETLRDADVLVNATPAGEGQLPLPAEAFRPELLVVDLAYWPPDPWLVRVARRAGCAAHNGLGMLLHQAALAFELWTATPAPLEVMSAAALRTIAHEG